MEDEEKGLNEDLLGGLF